ncbi:MAG TPA: hypothetical protein VFF79_12580 [Conexibacter sp.]|nr:hypothetical protein [Conexibacter sp.]
MADVVEALISQGVQRCPRCGADHGQVTFLRMANAIMAGCTPPLTHWASCPESGEPILARVTGTMMVASVATVVLDDVSERQVRRAIAGEDERS